MEYDSHSYIPILPGFCYHTQNNLKLSTTTRTTIGDDHVLSNSRHPLRGGKLVQDNEMERHEKRTKASRMASRQYSSPSPSSWRFLTVSFGSYSLPFRRSAHRHFPGVTGMFHRHGKRIRVFNTVRVSQHQALRLLARWSGMFRRRQGTKTGIYRRLWGTSRATDSSRISLTIVGNACSIEHDRLSNILIRLGQRWATGIPSCGI